MDRLTLTARIIREDSRFIATVEGINVRGVGESPEAARDELVQAMLSWISTRDCAESMAGALADAGFPEVDDETELELEFADFSEEEYTEPSDAGLKDGIENQD